MFQALVSATALAGANSLPGSPPVGDFYVSPNGDDANAGTLAAPFKTLQKCVDSAGAGTCTLRGGRYPDSAVVTAGVALQAYKGEDAIIDGSSVVAKKWTKTAPKSCIYRSAPYASSETVPWQLFLENMTPLTPARWPNGRLDDKSVFKPLVDGKGPLAYTARDSTFGNLVDDGSHSPSLASSGMDFTDCTVVLPLGTMGLNPIGAKVTSHSPGARNLTYEPPPGARFSIHPNNPYFFEGHPKLLDAEAEWSYDADTRQLMAWLPGCADPNTIEVRGKVKDYSLNVTSAQATVSGITFFGTTFGVDRGGITLKNVTLFTPTFNKRTIGEGMGTAATALRIGTTHTFEMSDSSVLYSEGGSTFSHVGKNSVFRNNLFSGSCYSVGSVASVADAGASNCLFEQNTIEHFNAFSGITPPMQGTIRRNVFKHQGPDVDGAGVHVHIKEQNGVLVEQNWMHDMTVKAIRFDRVNSKGATWGVNGTVVGNVWWRTSAAFMKGDKHTVDNNTAFGVPFKMGAMVVMMYDPKISWSKPHENEHTRIYNNAVDSLFNVSGVLPATPATRGNNVWDTDVAAQLVDPANFNFLPKPGSQIAKAGAGAYRYDDKNPWVPGCSFCSL
eukprot:TRINITY_DN795_c0_g1_i1.p1 TRINITY_DN795_c0_g1~~TRINITY_DN795_c0_g1_i1.p1  ORF type:complete len:614 (+),score=130.99 TRINITY_DN795_c0_g1_i1:49-1890(+)